MRTASFWNISVPQILTIYSLVVFAILWVGLAFTMIVNPALLDQIWNWVRALPLLQEIIAWVLFLPIMVGLWIRESSWPMIFRWLATAGLVGWTLLPVSNLIKGEAVNEFLTNNRIP
jgi:hypothetical protein